MPRFTLDISDAALLRLQKIVDAYNANNGTALTVLEWLKLHVRELAVQDDLMAAADTFRRQAEQSAADALVAERERLLSGV